MGLIETATRRRISVLMFTLAIALFGLVSLSRLKVNLLPDLSYPTVTIRTELPGAAPLEIESLLSKPIEEAVGIIKNVRQVRSISRSGQSDVILEFVWGTDMDLAGVDVREKIDLLDLPDEARRPLLLRFDPSNEPILRLALAREAGSSTAQLKELRRLAEEELKKDLESIEGTAAVKASGGLEEEIQVLVDQQRIAQLGLPISTVSERLRAENVNLAGGRLEEGAQRFLVRTVNEFKSIDDIANALIPTQAGRTVYLRDIATVRSGNKERTAITRLNGSESVELAVYKEGDANTVQVAKRVKAELEDIEEQLPEGTELTVVYDQSLFIDDAIKQVQA
ncbi:MAG: efflux RND transporter permease subunit, partial [Xanthomonadales bacterium]|nr:efflux RND transporter permease subunit [Xanthomonadales bacterium]